MKQFIKISLLSLLVNVLPSIALATVSSTVSSGALSISSQATNVGDTIVVDCVAGNLKVNGLDPSTGLVACNTITSIIFTGSSKADNFSFGIGALELLAITSVTLNGGNGNDTISGSPFADSINGGNGNDTLNGLAGNDILIGGNGKDTLLGGDDNDNLKGGNGKDTLKGEAGDDILNGGNANDNLDGGTGTNTLNDKLGSNKCTNNNLGNCGKSNSPGKKPTNKPGKNKPSKGK